MCDVMCVCVVVVVCLSIRLKMRKVKTVICSGFFIIVDHLTFKSPSEGSLICKKRVYTNRQFLVMTIVHNC